jgi:hypothetical protein
MPGGQSATACAVPDPRPQPARRFTVNLKLCSRGRSCNRAPARFAFQPSGEGRVTGWRVIRRNRLAACAGCETAKRRALSRSSVEDALRDVTNRVQSPGELRAGRRSQDHGGNRQPAQDAQERQLVSLLAPADGLRADIQGRSPTRDRSRFFRLNPTRFEMKHRVPPHKRGGVAAPSPGPGHSTAGPRPRRRPDPRSGVLGAGGARPTGWRRSPDRYVL